MNMSYALPEPANLLRLYRLLHELCEMGDDAYGWRGHFFSVVLPMIDADGGAAYVMKHPIDPSDIVPRTPLLMHFSSHESWQAHVEQGDLTDQPHTPAMMARMGTDFTCMRHELVDDETWYSSPFYKNVALPAGWDQMLNTQVAIMPPGYVNGFGFLRAPGKPAFTQREVNIVHFVHTELARQWRRADPLDVHLLPTRQRETLDRIRRGESRKTIAENMSVSVNTVHSYEKALFERAAVSSRGELLASLSSVIRPNLLP